MAETDVDRLAGPEILFVVLDFEVLERPVDGQRHRTAVVEHRVVDHAHQCRGVGAGIRRAALGEVGVLGRRIVEEGLQREERVADRFGAQFPQGELVLCTATDDGMLQMLTTNQVDLAYTLDHPLLQPTLVRAVDVPEPVCFIAPAGHPLAARDTVSLEELVQQEFLLTERGMSYRDALDQCLAAHGLQLQPYLELGSAALLCQMVEQGMGLSFLPEYIVRPALAAGRLARLNVPDCTVEMHRQLFYHRDKWLTPQMKAFIELVRQPAPGK